jgi:hypothetical protein
MDAPAAVLRGEGGLLLLCSLRVEHELADALLCCGANDGRRSANERRSLFTAYRRVGNVTLRRAPPQVSQMPNPIILSPSSGPLKAPFSEGSVVRKTPAGQDRPISAPRAVRRRPARC